MGLAPFCLRDLTESLEVRVDGVLFRSVNLFGSTVTANLQQLVLQGGGLRGSSVEQRLAGAGT